MAEKLTKQQEAAVYNRGGNLLVSAAAGSGKTKVLTDRILSYILDEKDPANVDDFLVITFTKTAAAELRVKIAEKLTRAIAANPNNQHLQRQMQRLHMAQISTVHSFCNNLLREYTYLLDISPDFRMVESSETVELQRRVLTQVLERAYERIGTDPAFYALVESQGIGRDDEDIPSAILRLYDSATCNLHPDKWLDSCVEMMTDDTYTDALQTPWGQYLQKDLNKIINMHIHSLEKCKRAAMKAVGMPKVPGIIDSIIAQLESLQKAKTWDELHRNQKVRFPSLSFAKDCTDDELRALIKDVKSDISDDINKYMKNFAADNANALKDVFSCGLSSSGLIALVKEYSREYNKLKKSLHIMDFSDLEHYTLDLLMGKSRSGPTALAHEIGARYREVMVDEYQDSSRVQDAIYMALTVAKNNCFMVGDVKQSIYQFRLAEPGIFISKYNSYANADVAKPGEGRRILLSDNFRSSGEVIDCVNDVFEINMSEEVGGLKYGEDERLREGIPHEPLGETEVELLTVQTQEAAYYEEGLVVAKRILELVDGTHKIRDEETHKLRAIEMKDIAILLRTRKPWPLIKKALETAKIPYVTADAENVLESTEITVLISLLKVINNPLQDIPLVSVLCSNLFQYTADDMARLRGLDPYASIYDLLQKDSDQKSKDFLAILEELRTDARIYSIGQLLENIVQKTRFDSVYGAMIDGVERMGHIQNFMKLASAYESSGGKDLRQFIEHLDASKASGLTDDTERKDSSAIRVMTIHQSKGLEFPVVFCMCLQRNINFKSIAESKVLCDRQLGLGLYSVDSERRIRYPNITRIAVDKKLRAETISEDLRVLYVAMTRARDRLIMTYAAKRLDTEIGGVVTKLALYDKSWISAFPGCPGTWILQTALRRTEAGPLFAIGGNPGCSSASKNPWKIEVRNIPDRGKMGSYRNKGYGFESVNLISDKLKEMLSFHYPYEPYTRIASKQTATQLKGRPKDHEAAEATTLQPIRYFRKPTFVSGGFAGNEYGNAYHGVMQYVRYDACGSLEDLEAELDRLEKLRLITGEQRKMINPAKIVNFVSSPIGQRLCKATQVRREFKFSIMVDALEDAETTDEKILLQGVVDCMMIEPDGITVVDFKTDRFETKDLKLKLEEHRAQVEAYAKAVERIFGLPVKEKVLYFFSIDQAASL